MTYYAQAAPSSHTAPTQGKSGGLGILLGCVTLR
jgi:hypothetical protein